MDRRFFLGSALASAVGATLSACGGGESDPVLDLASSDRRTTTTTTTTTTTAASAAVKSRVIVIGGGMGGATVAKYLRLWGDAISVTLVERMPTYTSNIMSSLVLSGQRSLSSLSYNYDTLRSKYGITTVFGEVVAIDPVAGKVTLANKTVLTADRIVMAPGISFDTVPGLGSSDKMPHAWQAGPQTTLAGQSAEGLAKQGRGRADHPQDAVPLPARTVRARLPDRGLAQGQETRLKADRARRQSGHRDRGG
jgi:sulfide dehydrogenase [flavocytochrome c] flavoprotein subunit